MYEYSLSSYLGVFDTALRDAKPDKIVDNRLKIHGRKKGSPHIPTNILAEVAIVFSVSQGTCERRWLRQCMTTPVWEFSRSINFSSASKWPRWSWTETTTWTKRSSTSTWRAILHLTGPKSLAHTHGYQKQDGRTEDGEVKLYKKISRKNMTWLWIRLWKRVGQLKMGFESLAGRTSSFWKPSMTASKTFARSGLLLLWHFFSVVNRQQILRMWRNMATSGALRKFGSTQVYL